MLFCIIDTDTIGWWPTYLCLCNRLTFNMQSLASCRLVLHISWHICYRYVLSVITPRNNGKNISFYTFVEWWQSSFSVVFQTITMSNWQHLLNYFFQMFLFCVVILTTYFNAITQYFMMLRIDWTSLIIFWTGENQIISIMKNYVFLLLI